MGKVSLLQQIQRLFERLFEISDTSPALEPSDEYGKLISFHYFISIFKISENY